MESQNISKERPNQHRYLLVKECIASIATGILTDIFDYPFDTMKVLQQIDPHSYTSVLDTVKKTFKKSGIFGFYRGISSHYVSCMLESTFALCSYKQSRRVLVNQFGITDDKTITLISGIVSGITVSFVLTPMELLKCRVQMMQLWQSKNIVRTYTGPWNVLYNVIKTDGFFGLFRGLYYTILREIPATTGQFVAYEYFLYLFRRSNRTDKNSDIAILVSGGMSGIAYWTLGFPADTVKTVIQTGHKSNISFLRGFQNIYRKQGFRGFFSGYGVTVIRTMPSSAIWFFIFEKILQLLGHP